MDQGEGNDRLLTQHQHIQQIIILGERLRDRAVVGWVRDGGVEDAMQPAQARWPIELIFHARPRRDLDAGGELSRQPFSGRDIVPGVDHARIRPPSCLDSRTAGVHLLG